MCRRSAPCWSAISLMPSPRGIQTSPVSGGSKSLLPKTMTLPSSRARNWRVSGELLSSEVPSTKLFLPLVDSANFTTALPRSSSTALSKATVSRGRVKKKLWVGPSNFRGRPLFLWSLATRSWAFSFLATRE